MQNVSNPHSAVKLLFLDKFFQSFKSTNSYLIIYLFYSQAGLKPLVSLLSKAELFFLFFSPFELLLVSIFSLASRCLSCLSLCCLAFNPYSKCPPPQLHQHFPTFCCSNFLFLTSLQKKKTTLNLFYLTANIIYHIAVHPSVLEFFFRRCSTEGELSPLHLHRAPFLLVPMSEILQEDLSPRITHMELPGLDSSRLSHAIVSFSHH